MNQTAREIKDLMKKSIDKSPNLDAVFSADKHPNIGFGSSTSTNNGTGLQMINKW